MNFNKRKGSWNIYMLLSGLIFLGAGLRLYGLSDKGLWMDELYSLSFSDPDNDLATVFHKTVEDVHPPFYQIVLWLVFKLFGYAELTSRYFSVVIGVSVIPAMFYLGEKLFSAWVGIYAGFLVSVNFFLISLSQDGRSYQLLVLLVIVSFIAFVDLIEKKNLKGVILYALTGSMLVNTHYFGVFPVMAQAVLLLYFSFRSGMKKKLLGMGGIAGLLIAMSLVSSVFYILDNWSRNVNWITRPEDDFFVEVFMTQIGRGLLALVYIFFLVCGLADLMRRDDRRDAMALLLLWWGLGIVIAYVRSVFYIPILTFKNMIVFLPVVILLTAYGIDLVRNGFCRCVVLVFVFVMSFTQLYSSPDLRSFRIGHDIRSPVSKIKRDQGTMPVYSPYPELISAYFKVLGYPIAVGSLESIEARMKTNKTPVCFYVVDMWNMAMNKDYQSRFDVEISSNQKYADTALIVYKVHGAIQCDGTAAGG